MDARNKSGHDERSGRTGETAQPTRSHTNFSIRTLAVCRASENRLTKIVSMGGIREVDHWGIETVPRGIHPTACGKGYGPDCASKELAEIELRHDGIELILYEKLSNLLYWSGGKWNRIAWSD